MLIYPILLIAALLSVLGMVSATSTISNYLTAHVTSESTYRVPQETDGEAGRSRAFNSFGVVWNSADELYVFIVTVLAGRRMRPIRKSMWLCVLIIPVSLTLVIVLAYLIAPPSLY